MAGTQDGDYREMDLNNGVIWSDRKHHMWFPISFTKYSIKDGRLYISEGCISSREDECMLYRIMDLTVTRSLGQKLFGTGTIHLNTKDRSTPVIHLVNIKNPIEVKRMLSRLIEEEREKLNIAGKEMIGSMGYTETMEYDRDISPKGGGGHHHF